MSAPKPNFLTFETHRNLKERLVISTLTGKPIIVKNIRSTSLTVGLEKHEYSLLRLLDSITNGAEIDISPTGTRIIYSPGLISGSVDSQGAKNGVLECWLEPEVRRGVSWFLLPLCMLAPFAKAPLNVRFRGEGVITSATVEGDISVDAVRTAILPLYTKFGIRAEKLELRIVQRSCAGPGGRGGGGEVEMRFGAQVRLPKTLHLNRSPGRVRRIRGVAYCTGVSNSNNGRMIHVARGVLNGLVSDVHVASQYDQAPLVSVGGRDKSNEGKKRRTGIGFGLCLVAESSAEGVVYSADVVSPSEGGVTPEDIGKQCAYQLLEAIATGGCVSKIGASTVLMLMAMGSEDVGRVRLGRDVVGSEEVIGLARDLRTFGASSWGLRDVEEDDTGDVIVTVKGTGIGNAGKKIQ